MPFPDATDTGLAPSALGRHGLDLGPSSPIFAGTWQALGATSVTARLGLPPNPRPQAAVTIQLRSSSQTPSQFCSDAPSRPDAVS